jgi:hypothetical protein
MNNDWIRPRDMGNADAEYDRLRELEDAREEAVAVLRRATAFVDLLAESAVDPAFIKALKP